MFKNRYDWQVISRVVTCVVMIVAINLQFLGQLAWANNKESFYTRNGIIFLDTEDSLAAEECAPLASSQASGQNASGGLSKDLMEIKNPDQFAQAIDQWVKKVNPRSPFVGLGKYAVMGGQRSGINPILPIVIARMETSLGTDPRAGKALREGHNAYGRTATRSQPHVASARLWYKWDSLADSLFDRSSRQDDMYAYIKSRYKDLKTIDETMMRYAPPHENNTASYLRNIKQWASEIYQLAGDSIGQTKLGALHNYDECVSDDRTLGGSAGGAVDLGNFNMYYQYKGAWSRQLIGRGSCLRSTFTECGCGPTSLAIVISNMIGDKSITPLTTRNFSDFPAGISWGSLVSVPQRYGLKVDRIGLNIARARETLRNGGMVILSQAHGPLTRTSRGHILVIRGLTSDGRFLIADPASERHTQNQQGYSDGDILGGAWAMWAVRK